MSAVAKSTNFPAKLEAEMFSKVVGHSALAKLSGAKPLSFNGNDVFVFDFSSDVSVVAEGGQKPAGDAAVTVKRITPVKVVYQSRVSDEFMYAAEEARMEVLSEFADGFAKKLGAALDKMAFHGVNPSTGSSSDVIGHNHLDYILTQTSNVITIGHDTTALDYNIEEAIALVEDEEYAVNGIVMSPIARTAMAALTQNSGERKYPDFAFGAAPANLGGAILDVNGTVSANSNLDRVIVGDFQNAFRWGFAKELPIEVIEYGNPDGGSYDLKNVNQVLIRSEAYIGWTFLNDDAFAAVKQGE